ncbi:MAG: hypothetical protein NVS1B6_00900 [Steroidobacteraceae bacterium]
MPQISKLVRTTVYTRLIDATLGFNAKLTARAGDYPGLDTGLLLIRDWSIASSNFLYGRVAPEFVEASSDYNYPLLTLDTMRTISGTGNQRWAMSDTFSGMTESVIDLHVSWLQASTIPDYASYGDLAEDAMFACLNSPVTIMTAAGLAYSGLLSMNRGPIVQGGSGTRQTLTFVVPFAASIA